MANVLTAVEAFAIAATVAAAHASCGVACVVNPGRSCAQNIAEALRVRAEKETRTNERD